MGVKDNNSSNFYHYLSTNANVLHLLPPTPLLLPSHMIRVLFYKSMQIFAVGSGHLYFSLLASSTVIFVYDMVVADAATAFVFVIIIVFIPFNIYYWLYPPLNGWSHFSWFRIKLIFQCCV